MGVTCNLVDIKTVCEFLKSNDDYLIATHSSPDGDTLGSGYGLRYILEQLGKRAKVVCADYIPQKFSYFITDNPEFTEKTIIAVDIADLALTTKLQDNLKDKVNLAIDHHKSNTKYAENLLLEENSASCSEIIFKIAEFLGVNISGKLADALYTGVCTDTGCFKYSNVTTDTFLTAAKLMNLGAKIAEINRLMFETKRKEQIEIEKMALDTLEYHFDDTCVIISITDEMIKTAGCLQSELEAITSVPRTIEGVLAGITIKQKDGDLFKISVRTHEPLDASKICEILGGGGHERAAGCSVRGNLENAKSKILSAVESVMKKS